MKHLHPLFPIILIILLGLPLQAQQTEQVIAVPIIQASLGAHLSGGQLNDRFGPVFSAGPSFLYKTEKNWIWGLDGDFLFGNTVKEDDIFDAISTEQGFIIDAGGLYADVYTSMRGFRIAAKAGKLLPLHGTNLNAGILLTAGAGLLQHKIRIDNKGSRAPQLDNQYLKGYDRLSNGLALTAGAAYFHLSPKKLYNYYFGLELSTAFTRSRRDWDFDKMKKDDTRRLDLLLGLKTGWSIPLYGGSKQKTYYY